MSSPGRGDADMPEDARTPAASAQTPASSAARTPGAFSSPLQFPSSSPAKSTASTARPSGSQRAPASSRNGQSSPLHFPSSSEAGTPRASARAATGAAARAQGRSGAGRGVPSSSLRSDASSDFRGGGARGLFFDESPRSNLSTPRARRGEIHSSAILASPSVVRTARMPVRNAGAASAPGSDVSMHANSDFTLSQAAPTTDDAAPPVQDGEHKVIWGTGVGISETLTACQEFLRGFRLKYRWAAAAVADKQGDRSRQIPEGRTAEQGEALVYQGYMRRMRLTDQTSLNVRVSDLAAFGPSRKLAHWIIKYPSEVVAIFDTVLKDEMLALAELDERSARDGMDGGADIDIERMQGMTYKVRPFGHDTVNMRDLNPGDIDKLVTVRGLVIRCTPIIPDMRNAFFRCLACNHTMSVELDRGRIAEPDRCPRDVCGQQGTIALIHNRCEFADRQVIRLQETPDAVPDGQTPHTVTLCAYDELVDVSKPGDRVEITGIFRSQAVRVNPRARTQKSLYKTFLDVIHVKRGNARRLGVDASTRDENERGDGRGAQSLGVGGEEDDDEDLDTRTSGAFDIPTRRQTTAGGSQGVSAAEELQAKLRSIAERPDCYELLARSLAPSIYEMDDVKKGILLQLFGGTNKTISSGGGQGGPRYRGDINVLMVGDPGTSKSQLLMYVHKIAPRGVYASGKGSSAVGLTAYVTRDPDSKQLVLESGALVLSDGGVCCIDEFDKMSDATRSVLHEVMEQQTVSIAKAGIITTLNARTSVLAAANPVGSKYNVKLPITRNIDLPPTLISRFDLVYLVLDKVDEASDRRLARHLVGLYLEDAPSTGGSDILPIETLTAYIGYVRNHVQPVLTEAAGSALAERYVALRKAGEDPRSAERRITATTRQLESMIRLSEAHARMRWSETVDVEDVEEACRLIAEATKSSATDPTTGLIDLDLVNTGRGLAGRKMAGDLRRETLALLESMGGGSADGSVPPRAVRYADVAKALADQSTYGAVDPTELYDLMRALDTEGLVKLAGTGERRTVRRIL